ncbi:MAG: lysine--tRNA ligase [Candidatus Eremiobacteraeota bacterium]|nr:lysine--tRNA ligase [Candidatus Eremiobacteraeota bacterium]MBC5801521.1 lysine--tRNA ligase [Candidatus Eremiobacteraeota bacterium]MBC5821086.1 lysine--tRNA ligase [Candidatus Eremiobacteraeota bacterium]
MRAARRANLAALRARGRDPFLETRFDVTAHASELLERYANLSAEEQPPQVTFSVAGRLLGLRKMGKGAVWADVWDRSGRLQIYVRADAVGEEAFAAFDALDLGDIIGVSGTVFRSKKGDLTLRVARFEVLAKSLAPTPDKWHGLGDVEKRYRQRYVDLMIDERVRRIFLTRSAIVAEMRRFCDAHGFVECETPTMLHVAGGAAARPFRTHHNALGLDLDLRIATELNLKRLIVGGLERVYEIGRIWRNEGIDTTHNPEFTMLELYAAYWSLHEMMDFNETLFAHVVEKVHASSDVKYGERTLSFARPFRRMAYFEALAQWGGLDRATLLDPAGAARSLAEMGLPPSATHAQALDKIFERVVEPRLIDPTFVYDYPVALSPLAKRKAGDSDLVDRYELFAANFELSNAFTELNDPDDQRARFEAQIEERKRGNDEVPAPDWDFVTALEYGMPPTAGIGIGVDRVVMLLTGQQSIREVILFPLQRPL